MTETARHNLPLLQSAQAQKETDINEAFSRLDALAMAVFRSVTLDTPPADGFNEGDIYALPRPGNGAWAGQPAGALAIRIGGAWVFCPPGVGKRGYSMTEGIIRVWDGAAWTNAASGAAIANLPGGGADGDFLRQGQPPTWRSPAQVRADIEALRSPATPLTAGQYLQQGDDGRLAGVADPAGGGYRGLVAHPEPNYSPPLTGFTIIPFQAPTFDSDSIYSGSIGLNFNAALGRGYRFIDIVLAVRGFAIHNSTYAFIRKDNNDYVSIARRNVGLGTPNSIFLAVTACPLQGIMILDCGIGESGGGDLAASSFISMHFYN